MQGGRIQARQLSAFFKCLYRRGLPQLTRPDSSFICQLLPCWLSPDGVRRTKVPVVFDLGFGYNERILRKKLRDSACMRQWYVFEIFV